MLHERMAVFVEHTPHTCQTDVSNHVVNQDGMSDTLTQIKTLIGANRLFFHRHSLLIEEGKPPSMAMDITVGEKLPKVTINRYLFAAA